jgi:hypothetical protein
MFLACPLLPLLILRAVGLVLTAGTANATLSGTLLWDGQTLRWSIWLGWSVMLRTAARWNLWLGKLRLCTERSCNRRLWKLNLWNLTKDKERRDFAGCYSAISAIDYPHYILLEPIITSSVVLPLGV